MKDFDAVGTSRYDRLSKTKSFKIGGVTFNCVRDIHPDIFIQSEENFDEDGGVRTTIESISWFIRETIVPAERPGWDQLRDNRDDPITLDDLAEIQTYLIEAYSGRPTENPSDSGGQPASSGTPSTASPSESQESI